MLSRLYIGFFAVLLFGLSSAHTYADGYLNEPLQEVNLPDKQEESGDDTEVRVSLSYEAVFQVFHFVSKSWETKILAFTPVEVYQEAAVEFLIRDFLVPRSSTLFRQIISRNAP